MKAESPREKESENGEISAQPDDPDGVSRDMATAALDRGMLPGRAHRSGQVRASGQRPSSLATGGR